MNNNNHSEFNKTNEFNNSNNFLEFNNNSEVEINKKNKPFIKLFSSFFVMSTCVIVLYSTGIVNNILPKEDEVISESIEEIDEVVLNEATYNIIDSPNYNRIDFKVEINNVKDIDKKNYFVFLIDDSFIINNINDVNIDFIKLNKKDIKSLTFNDYFETCINSKGINKLKKNSNYLLYLVCDNTIIKKVEVKTLDYNYIDSLVFSKNYDVNFKYLKIEIKQNSAFTCNSFLVRLYNKKLKEFVSDFSIVPCDRTFELFPLFTFKKDLPEYEYEVYIYCSIDDSSSIEFFDKYEKDDVMFYLICKYEKTYVI